MMGLLLWVSIWNQAWYLTLFRDPNLSLFKKEISSSYLKFALDNQLVINQKKTKVICFSKTRKWNFLPELCLSDDIILKTETSIKLVGVIVSNDLKWTENTDYICQKAMKKIWVLRRMIFMGLETEHIFDTYTKEVRSILELAVPVWHSSLTKKLSSDI